MVDRLITSGFVRHVRDGVRHGVRIGTRVNTGLCGMCGITRTRAHECKFSSPSKRAICISHAHVNTCRTYRTYRTTPSTTRISAVRHVYSYTAQPAHKEIEKESRMEKPLQAPALVAPITCGPDNVSEFNAALRAHLPGAHDLIKALMARGMMDGLRGVQIGPQGSLPSGVQPVLSPEAEKRLQGHQPS